MVENVNDQSTSPYSSRRGSVQTKNFNNNSTSSSVNYQIVSINKESNSNQHNIRIGIPRIISTKGVHEQSVDGFNERSVDMEPSHRSNRCVLLLSYEV